MLMLEITTIFEISYTTLSCLPHIWNEFFKFGGNEETYTPNFLYPNAPAHTPNVHCVVEQMDV